MPSPVITKKKEFEPKEGDIPLEKTGEGVWSYRKEGYAMELHKELKGPVVIERFDIGFRGAVAKRWEGTLIRTTTFNGPKIGEVKFEFSQEGHKPFHIVTIDIGKEYENLKETNEFSVESVITKKIKSRLMDKLQFEVGFMIDDTMRFGGRGFGLISMNVSFITFYEGGAATGEKTILPLENDYREKMTLHKEEKTMKDFLKKVGELA
jgi:hypothetical protein